MRLKHGHRNISFFHCGWPSCTFHDSYLLFLRLGCLAGNYTFPLHTTILGCVVIHCFKGQEGIYKATQMRVRACENTQPSPETPQPPLTPTPITLQPHNSGTVAHDYGMSPTNSPCPHPNFVTLCHTGWLSPSTPTHVTKWVVKRLQELWYTNPSMPSRYLRLPHHEYGTSMGPPLVDMT